MGVALRGFTVSPQQQWFSTIPWGNGHTTTTDPTKRGWRLRAVSSQLAVIGRTGVKGCLSVMRLSREFDVAFYDDEKPEVVFQRLRSGERLCADAYRQIGTESGWALPLVQEIERDEC